MRLLIDAGNTRIKWAVVQGDTWLHNGVLPIEGAAELSVHIDNLCNIREAWVSNVAGEKVERHIRDAGVERTYFITAQKSQCGVRNGYSTSDQLGSDRWAALIAAWSLVQGEVLVVNCGTATTIDALSAQGEFTGGLILPGVELMQHCLAETASQVKAGGGKYMRFPQNTSDALFSGAVQATCGAIERQHGLLGGSAPVILSGGAAELLKPYLGIPARSVDNLVLGGLLLIAQESRAA